MGQRFPPGYPVGVVAKSAVEVGERFATVNLIPAAHIDKSEQVLLAWPQQGAAYDQAVQQQLKAAMSERIS